MDEELEATVRRFKKAVIERALGGDWPIIWAPPRRSQTKASVAMGKGARRW